MPLKTKKLTVFVQGGLGNQLFCYAIARSYSLLHNRICALDNQSGYAHDQFQRVNRLHDLHLFNGCEEGLIKKDLMSRISKFLPIKYRSLVKEKYIGNIDLLNVDFQRNDVYFKGYWQSEKYFKTIKAILLQELRPKNEILNNDVLMRIQSSNSVFIHVRRMQYRHQLQLNYYEEAITVMTKKVADPKFFVFGDDLDWTNSQGVFKDNCEIISSDDNKSEMPDYLLMNSCKHAIIANSSFSWWAAWLNDDENQVVICPDHTGFGLELAEGWLKMKVNY